MNHKVFPPNLFPFQLYQLYLSQIVLFNIILSNLVYKKISSVAFDFDKQYDYPIEQ